MKRLNLHLVRGQGGCRSIVVIWFVLKVPREIGLNTIKLLGALFLFSLQKVSRSIYFIRVFCFFFSYESINNIVSLSTVQMKQTGNCVLEI